MFGTQHAYIEYTKTCCYALTDHSANFRSVKTPQACAAIVLKRKSDIVDREAVSAAAGGLQHLTMTKASLSQARPQIAAIRLLRGTHHALHPPDSLNWTFISMVNAHLRQGDGAG